jgi:muramidase (phage lysozyme)
VASYQEQITLIVKGLDQIGNLERRLTRINNEIDQLNQKRLNIRQLRSAGAFEDPLTDEALRGAEVGVRAARRGRSRIRSERLGDVAKARSGVSDAERELLAQSKLNAAVDLYQNRLKRLERGGGGKNLTNALKEQVQEIQEAYRVATDGGKKNLAIVRSLANELGRIATAQDEINSRGELQSRNFAPLQRAERLLARARNIPSVANQNIINTAQGNLERVRSAQASGLPIEARQARRRLDNNTRQIEALLDAELDDTKARVSLGKQRLKAEADTLKTSQALNAKAKGVTSFVEGAIAAADSREARIKSGEIFEGYAAVRPPKPVSGKTLADFDKRLAEAGGNRAKALEEYNATIRRLNEQVAASYKRWEDAVDDQAKAIEGLGARGGRGSVFRNTDAFRRKVERAADKTLKDAKKGFPSSPIGGLPGIPGSPAAIEAERQAAIRAQREQARNAAAEQRAAKERRRGRLNTIGSAAIGGGFPLLFGQGAGAGIGGGVGGLLGGALGGSGGFAGGIVGSLIGTQFDKLAQAATTTANALKDPIKNFQALADASFFAGKQQEFLVRKLIELGRVSEAQAVIQQRVIEQVGVGGYNELVRLGAATTEVGKAWNELSLQLQAALAGPLADFLTWLAEVVQAIGAGNREVARLDDLRSSLRSNPALSKQFEKEFADTYKNQPLFGEGTSEKLQKELIDKYSKLVPPPARRATELSPDNQELQLNEAIQRQKEIEDLRRRGIQLEISQEDFRRDQEEAIYNFRKRADDYTREVAEFRRGIEDKIFEKQQANARTLADLTRQQAQNAIERRDQALEPLGRIAPEEGGGRAAGVDLVREYIRVRAEGEADLQQKETETQLKIQEIRRDSDKFRLDIEKKVYEFQQKAEQFARDVTKYEWETSKKVYALQIEAADYQYAMWENAYKRQTEITAMQREANMSNPLGAVGDSGPLPAGMVSGKQTAAPNLNPRERAWLDTIAFAEGTFRNNGYNTIFGYQQFTDYSRHPDRVVRSNGLASAAAGRYQFMPGTWGPLGLPNFGPANQDIGALRLMQRRGVPAATSDFTREMAARLAPEWASFPTMRGGSYYPGQGAKSYEDLRRFYYQRQQMYASGGGAAAPNAMGTPIGATVGGAAPAAPVTLTKPMPLPARRAGGQGPAYLPQLPGAPDVSALERSYLGLNEQQAQLLQRLQQEAGVRNEIAAIAAQTKLEEGVAAIGQQYLQPVLDARQAAEDRLATEKQYSELLQAGVLPALAEQLSQADELERTQLRLLDIQIKNAQAVDAELQARIEINRQLTKRTPEQDAELTNLLATWRANQTVLGGLGNTRAGILGAGDQLQAQIMENESPEARRRRTIGEYNRRKNEREDENRPFDQYMKAKADLEDLIDPLNQIMSATDALGSAFGDAFQSIISGSESADEALKKMFANIGSYFLNMAAQILAQQALTSILGLLSGGAGAAAGGGNLFGNVGILNSGIGAGFGGARASGGPVDSGSAYLVGEQGPELFIPGISGTIASAKNTTEALKPSGQMMGGDTAMPEINYDGPVLNFNSTEYVMKKDVPKIIAAGTAATGSKMRNSIAFRKRAGI